ncbi:MAG: sigma-54 dependent transcriptional regulator [Gemmatimonadales bacterium]
MADQIVVVEDDRELREFLEEALRDSGYTPISFGSAEAALRHLETSRPPDLILTDLMLPGRSGEELLREVRERLPGVHVLIMTAFGTIASAIELTRAGAFDYLTKPLGTEHLLHAVSQALAAGRSPRRAPASRPAVAGFIGSAPPMLQLYSMIERAAGSPHAVLVTGESGTGKELVAHALHQLSARGAFVTVNCGALPEQLLESELFGHEKGAFTGADRTKDGLFHVADRGTLFLDEIAELPLALQPKLLRVLEQSEVRRVGGTVARKVDARVIAATHRDLEAEVRAGRFRDDLFWRLNVLTIDVPSLRERPEDIPDLAKSFLPAAVPERAASQAPSHFSPEALAILTSYAWPGNVRELRNAVFRAATLADGPEILPEHLPARIRAGGESAGLVTRAAEQQLTLEELERLYVLQTLRQTAGNKSRAAELLGLDRKTLYRKLEEYRSTGSSEGGSV